MHHVQMNQVAKLQTCFDCNCSNVAAARWQMNHLFQIQCCNSSRLQQVQVHQQLHSEKLEECRGWRLPVCNDTLGIVPLCLPFRQ